MKMIGMGRNCFLEETGSIELGGKSLENPPTAAQSGDPRKVAEKTGESQATITIIRAVERP